MSTGKYTDADVATPVANTETAPQGNDESGFFGEITGPIQDAYDAAIAKPSAEEEQSVGHIGRGLANFGRGVMELAQPVIHPVKTAMALPKMVAGVGMNAPIPMMVRGAINDVKENGWEDALPHIVGQIAGGYLGGKALEGAGEVPGKLRNFRPQSDPAIVPPAQTAAEKLAASIVPKAKQVPGFVGDVQSQGGNIVDFIRKSQNPMRTQAEFEKALQGAGDERYQHFQNNILGPNADQPMEVPDNYGGTRAGQKTATLGDVNKRIGRINNLLSPAYGKANPADVATALAQTTPEALQAEHAALTPGFHDALSQATGIPAEDIANLRKDFGTLRGLGNTVTDARASRLTKIGAGAEGASLPASKTGIMGKIWETMHGGQDAMANRAMQKGWSAFEPVAGQGRPLPQSPEGFQAQRAAQLADNQAQAQAEALRAHELEQGSQQAAAGRSQAAGELRKMNVGKQQSAAQQEFTHGQNLEQQAQAAADQRAAEAARLRESNVDTQKQSAMLEATKAHELEQQAQAAADARASRVAGFRQSRDAMNQANTKLQGEAARTIGRQRVLNQRSQ